MEIKKDSFKQQHHKEQNNKYKGNYAMKNTSQNNIELNSNHNTQKTNNSTNTQTLLTRKQVANMLGLKETTLAVWACTKRYNLPYIKVGKSVRYKLADIEAFLQERKQER